MRHTMTHKNKKRKASKPELFVVLCKDNDVPDDNIVLLDTVEFANKKAALIAIDNEIQEDHNNKKHYTYYVAKYVIEAKEDVPKPIQPKVLIKNL